MGRPRCHIHRGGLGRRFAVRKTLLGFDKRNIIGYAFYMRETSILESISISTFRPFATFEMKRSVNLLVERVQKKPQTMSHAPC